MTLPRGSRVLVTGATGFLGGAVARRLQGEGAHVVAQGRDPRAGAILREEGLEVWLESLEHRDAVRAELERRAPKYVVHCAALSAPFGPKAAFLRSNVDATARLVEASEAVGVERFIHVSTPAIYSSGMPLHRVREDALLPERPVNHYAGSKRAAEEVVNTACSRGLQAVILRPRAIYGPGDRALFPRLLRALEEGKLPIIGTGENRIDLTYIDDAVHGVSCALGAGPAAVGRAYNLTGPEPVALWDVIRSLALALELPLPERRVSYRAARAAAAVSEALHRVLRRPGEPRLTRYSVDSLALDATLDIEAARRDLGYDPKVPVPEGIRLFLASLRESTLP